MTPDLPPVQQEIVQPMKPKDSVLFSELHHRSLYWEALVQIAKGNREKATEVADMIRKRKFHPKKFPWQAKQPESIDDFFDKLFISHVSRSPQTLSFLGLFESIGLNAHNAFLDDLSPRGIIDAHIDRINNLRILNQYDTSTFTPDQLLSYKIFKWLLEHETSGEKFLFHEYRTRQILGQLQYLTQTLTEFHALNSEEDVENYMQRLQRIPEHFDQIIETINQQEKFRILPPRFMIDRVISSIDDFMKPPAHENILVSHLKEEMPEVSLAHKEVLVSRATAITVHGVYPAFQKLKTRLEKLKDKVQTNHGVWALPRGDEYYDYMLREHTTTGLSAEEIHELGLKEVKQIQDQIREILAKEGIEDAEKPLGELIDQLAQQDRFYYAENEEGRKQCVADYEAILERCRKELWPLFDITPKSKVEVQPVPFHMQEGAPMAYYYPPSLDGKRPGVFYINLRVMRELPKFGMETLAVHEAEPGHHFQFTLQNEMEIPTLRKLGWYTAYVEGWALYTEKLAYERGFYSDSFYELGHLQDELLRAVRLVVDTGIHRKRWSREEAIDYMVNATGFHRDSVVTEVERYFVMPGQACAYKVGQLKILELRDRAKKKLGDKFDIREFHNVVLQTAAVPLDILEEVMDDYLERKQPSL